MNTYFSIDAHYKISEANINFYASPFVHPRRKMNEHDFIYILQGEWEFGQDDEKYTATKDSVLILSANHTHFGAAPCLPNTKTMYFHVNCENVSANDTRRTDISIDTLNDVSTNSNIKKYFSEIVNCKLQGKQTQADIFFKLLLCELSEPVEVSKNNLALKIQKIIHNNPEKTYTNAKIAEICNASVKTIENHFKAAFDTTIHQYMLEFKINEAVNYFKNFPEITAKEVAYNLGFYDEYHFSKRFKKIKGISPSMYIKNIKHNNSSK